jgi:hypothetical protein
MPRGGGGIKDHVVFQGHRTEEMTDWILQFLGIIK